MTTVYLVTVNHKPMRVFRKEHAAEDWIDHHSAPQLCAIVEIPLIE